MFNTTLLYLYYDICMCITINQMFQKTAKTTTFAAVGNLK